MPGVPLTYVSIGDSVLQRIGLQTRPTGARRGQRKGDETTPWCRPKTIRQPIWAIVSKHQLKSAATRGWECRLTAQLVGLLLYTSPNMDNAIHANSNILGLPIF
jgi:hypothetical protein